LLKYLTGNTHDDSVVSKPNEGRIERAQVDFSLSTLNNQRKDSTQANLAVSTLNKSRIERAQVNHSLSTPNDQINGSTHADFAVSTLNKGSNKNCSPRSTLS